MPGGGRAGERTGGKSGEARCLGQIEARGICGSERGRGAKRSVAREPGPRCEERAEEGPGCEERRGAEAVPSTRRTPALCLLCLRGRVWCSAARCTAARPRRWVAVAPAAAAAGPTESLKKEFHHGLALLRGGTGRLAHQHPMPACHRPCIPLRGHLDATRGNACF